MDLYMKICPVKMLYHTLAERDSLHCAAVICTDEKINHTKLRGIPFVQTAFADITTPGGSAFDRKHARKIAYFVDSLPEDVSTLYICCSAGESRSSAVAAAIMRYFGQNDMQIWRNPKYHPNTLVYKTLCQELAVDISKYQLWRRKRINKQAFSNAIRRARR